MAREKQLNLEFANLHCLFGDKFVLLDLAEEVVLPAFQDQNIVRKYGRNKTFFHDVEIVQLAPGDPPTIGIAGRFIQDTFFERDQVYDKASKRLVRKSGSLESAPSSLFLLVLNSHRLLYVKETRFAPPLSTFAASLEYFLGKKLEAFIQKLADENKAARAIDATKKKVSKKDLREEYPPPTVKVVPLASDQSLVEFIRRFKILSKVEVVFIETNDERDPSGFFDELRREQEEYGSRTSKLVHSNAAGLNPGKATQSLAVLAERGNTEIRLSGEDHSNDRLSGNNEKFKLTVPLENLGANVVGAAKKMFGVFQEQIINGALKQPIQPGDKAAKLRRLARRFLREQP